MVLLSGHSLARAQKFAVGKAALNLEERSGSLGMELGSEAPEIPFGAWILDESGPGAGMVWRARSQEDRYTEGGGRTVTAEHLIQTLNDVVLFGTHGPEQMAGTGATTVNARTAVNYVLARQNDWRLGQFDYDNVSQPFEFTGDTLYSALETISSALADCEWKYDFSTYPFRIHLVRQATEGATAEMRGNRNLGSCRKTVDRSGMYTRIYPIGKDDLRLPEQFLEQNTALYGWIHRIETDSSIETVDALRAWARERLARHCEPLVTVTADGLYLARETGESLDDLMIGKRCRIPMPELGTTITERIVKLAWRDKIGAPEKVNVTMANKRDDIATILRREINQGGSGGGRGARKSKKDAEDHAWFVDTTDHVAMVAEAVAGEGAAQDWSRVAAVVVDGNGVHQRVTKAEGDIVTNSASIEMVENRVAIVVDANGHVKPAQIVAAINDGASTIKISADHIELDGEAVADSLAGATIECNSVTAYGTCEFKDSTTFESDVTFDEGITCGNQYMNVADISISGNTLTITYTDGTQETFSKAVSLPAGTWSGTVAAGKYFQYTATQNGVVVGTGYSPQIDDIYQSAPVSWDNDYKGFNQKIRAQDENGVDLIEEEIHFDTTASWTAGKNSVTTITPTAINVYTSQQGTLLSTRLSASVLTAGKYITLRVGSTTYSIQIT